MAGLLIFYGVILVIGGTLLVRNSVVYRYRSRVIDGIYKTTMAEIDSGKCKQAKSEHRLNHFRQVSYDKMVVMFWRKPSSFFDQKFLKEIGMK